VRTPEELIQCFREASEKLAQISQKSVVGTAWAVFSLKSCLIKLAIERKISVEQRLPYMQIGIHLACEHAPDVIDIVEKLSELKCGALLIDLL